MKATNRGESAEHHSKSYDPEECEAEKKLYRSFFKENYIIYKVFKIKSTFILFFILFFSQKPRL